MPSAAAASTRMALVTGLCLLVHGCEDVNGGAVELSWKLRPSSSALEDKFVGCDPDGGRETPGLGPVVKMLLEWEVLDKDGVFWTGSRDWKCDANHGVTGFELPAGEALLTVTPLCKDGMPMESSYIAPAAEQRSVIVGDTISLGAVEIILVVTDCQKQHCICGQIALGHTEPR